MVLVRDCQAALVLFEMDIKGGFHKGKTIRTEARPGEIKRRRALLTVRDDWCNKKETLSQDMFVPQNKPSEKNTMFRCDVKELFLCFFLLNYLWATQMKNEDIQARSWLFHNWCYHSVPICHVYHWNVKDWLIDKVAKWSICGCPELLSCRISSYLHAAGRNEGVTDQNAQNIPERRQKDVPVPFTPQCPIPLISAPCPHTETHMYTQRYANTSVCLF